MSGSEERNGIFQAEAEAKGFDQEFQRELQRLDQQLGIVINRHAATISRLEEFVSQREPAVVLQQRIVGFLQAEANKLARQKELENIKRGKLIVRPEDQVGIPDFEDLRTNRGTEELLRVVGYYLGLPKSIAANTEKVVEFLKASDSAGAPQLPTEVGFIKMALITEVEERIQNFSKFLDEAKTVLDNETEGS